MAPASKKKKKPIANPARGFATTSVASKPKSEKVTELEPVSVITQEDSTVTSSVAADTPVITVSKVERELHELSPDELEKRLEESELQLIVEKHGAKSQREALRSVSKLQTDCRLMRAQAQSISTRQLISKEAVERALELAAEDITVVTPPTSEHQSRRVSSEEDATIRIWVLQLALFALGFSEGTVENALKYVLRYPPAESSTITWGLDECFDWLALNVEEHDLPEYDSQTGRVKSFNKINTGKHYDPNLW